LTNGYTTPPPLIEKPSCLLTGNIADGFTADGVIYSRASAETDFQKNVIGKSGGPIDPSDAFTSQDWFHNETRGASWSCRGTDGSPDAREVMWHTVKLIDVVGCHSPDVEVGVLGSNVHSYFMPDGTAVATYDDGTLKTDYDLTPMAVLMKSLGKCR
jgi:hypothetical protein